MLPHPPSINKYPFWSRNITPWKILDPKISYSGDQNLENVRSMLLEFKVG